MASNQSPLVGIVMGSKSDYEQMSAAAEILTELKIPSESRILSAHRTPGETHKYAASARERGLAVIIAGAGGAAHLAGVIAANTLLPVIGVPIQTSALGGMDSLLSTVQMPRGIPVATMAIGKAGAANAAIFAAQILGLNQPEIAAALASWRAARAQELLQQKLP
ncbi:MAG: 5-(carboxyamino)imidazole ribonucleotide mutase [Candidatus Binataceae bacterium]